MVFSELTFLYAFLPLNLLLYALAKDIRTKNTVMLIFSLVFYAWGEPVYLLLLLFMTLSNWYIALQVGRTRRNPKSAKAWLIAACVIDLGAIGVFKYGSFLLGNTHALFGFPETVPNILLPIGISFYTFQILSYVVDVYRGEVPPQKSFRMLLLYISLFHQCIAGPIVRYQDVAEELVTRRVSMRDISEGVSRFTVGLAKKAVFANHCGLLADSWLGTDSSLLSSRPTVALWLGMFAYSLQIYLDFSAYSDMAIGMGRMIGFHYKENFDYPYISQSVTEFWRRWHMSLGSFFRDYVYIPLGGNRCSKARHLLNMFIVWFLTGFWHGASWNYVLWGLYFFVFLAVEKNLLLKKSASWPRALRHMYLIFVVFFGWVLFRFENLADVGTVLIGLFGFGKGGFTDFETGNLLWSNILFLLFAVIACTPVMKYASQILRRMSTRSKAGLCVYGVATIIVPILLLLLSTALLVGDSFNPFLYFQF